MPSGGGYIINALPVSKAKIGDLIGAAKAALIRYVYNFGNDWAHVIQVTAIGYLTPADL